MTISLPGLDAEKMQPDTWRQCAPGFIGAIVRDFKDRSLSQNEFAFCHLRVVWLCMYSVVYI